MYLIRVELERRRPEVRQALADCQKMHRLVAGLFGTSRQENDILYRTNILADQVHLYFYASRPAPEETARRYRTAQRDITPWVTGLRPGQYLRFDLIAAPSKKVAEAGQKNSRRRILREPSQRLDWLERKAAQSGFAICQVEELEQVHASGKHPAERGGIMYHDAYHYQGILRITDPDAFHSALRKGIGPGKAYGFGMMMVKSL